jgi:CPA2 family monovalent cation:H+ antiporter-2
VVFAASSVEPAVLIELGLVIVLLSVLARVATHFELSPIPLYLLAGLVLGEGSFVPLDVSEQFISTGASIGVVLLLLTLGLEYTAEELTTNLRTGAPAAAVDLAANAAPGVAVGVLAGWGLEGAALMGGTTYISSSGIVSKLLSDLGRLGNRETPTVLSLLVFEDLVMAAYLPVVGVMLAGTALLAGAVSVAVALAAVAVVLLLALRHGHHFSRWVTSDSDEVVLLTVLGVTLVVAGVAEEVQVSAAVGAFLVGIALSGPVSEKAGELVSPLRDLFATIFFLFFSLQIDPGDLPGALPVATALAVVTAATKALSTGWATKRAGVGRRGRIRAATVMVARGEFSIILAGLGVAAGVDQGLGPVSAAYVLILATAGPVLTRSSGSIADWLEHRSPEAQRLR